MVLVVHRKNIGLFVVLRYPSTLHNKYKGFHESSGARLYRNISIYTIVSGVVVVAAVELGIQHGSCRCLRDFSLSHEYSFETTDE